MRFAVLFPAECLLPAQTGNAREDTLRVASRLRSVSRIEFLILLQQRDPVTCSPTVTVVGNRNCVAGAYGNRMSRVGARIRCIRHARNRRGGAIDPQHHGKAVSSGAETVKGEVTDHAGAGCWHLNIRLGSRTVGGEQTDEAVIEEGYA
jgi:hypothetical protein